MRVGNGIEHAANPLAAHHFGGTVGQSVLRPGTFTGTGSLLPAMVQHFRNKAEQELVRLSLNMLF